MNNNKYWERAWSLVEGCTPVSEACENCWLKGIARRFGDNFERIITRSDRLDIPLKRKKPTVWAVWSDLFHKEVPNAFIHDAFDIMKECRQHTFLVLTKRPERIYNVLYGHEGDYYMGGGDYLSNIYLGTTAENQGMADKRIPHLLKLDYWKKFLSLEPLLGEIDLLNCRYSGVPKDRYFGHVGSCECREKISGKCKSNNPNWCTYNYLSHINAVIVGTESGSRRRECKIEWIRSVVEQCKATSTPVFVKQIHLNGKLVKDIDQFP